MKKIYEAPELRLVRFTIRDVLDGSPLEGGINENIGGEDNNPIDDLDAELP